MRTLVAEVGTSNVFFHVYFDSTAGRRYRTGANHPIFYYWYYLYHIQYGKTEWSSYIWNVITDKDHVWSGIWTRWSP
jgi:hypothetical protein